MAGPGKPQSDFEGAWATKEAYGLVVHGGSPTTGMCLLSDGGGFVVPMFWPTPAIAAEVDHDRDSKGDAWVPVAYQDMPPGHNVPSAYVPNGNVVGHTPKPPQPASLWEGPKGKDAGSGWGVVWTGADPAGHYDALGWYQNDDYHGLSAGPLEFSRDHADAIATALNRSHPWLTGWGIVESEYLARGVQPENVDGLVIETLAGSIGGSLAVIGIMACVMFAVFGF